MIRICDIEAHLKDCGEELDTRILNSIDELHVKAKNEKDEVSANKLWCLKKIAKVQSDYLKMYSHLQKAANSSNEIDAEAGDSDKGKEYEAAWNLIEQCDINIGFLEENYCLEDPIDNYYIIKILNDVIRLKALFPYKLFSSREAIIKKEKCSICGNVINPRNPCGHIKGKLYMGEMCMHEVLDIEFLSINIVTNPFDQYAILKESGKTFDFSLLDYVTPHISPYKEWYYTIENRLLSKYKKVGRNEKCPCGSGLKYKKCIMTNRDIHYEDHYVFHV